MSNNEVMIISSDIGGQRIELSCIKNEQGDIEQFKVSEIDEEAEVVVYILFFKEKDSAIHAYNEAVRGYFAATFS